MDLSQEEYKKIEEFAFEYYRGLDYLHSIDHAERTVQIAEYLAEKEGANKELVRLGALLHQFHDNEAILISFLESLDLDKETIDVLVGFPLFRPYKNVEPNSIEEQVVFDADAVQVLGAYGTVREIAQYAERMHDLASAVEKVREIHKNFLNNLQTESAKQLIKESQQSAEDFLKLFDREYKGQYK